MNLVRFVIPIMLLLVLSSFSNAIGIGASPSRLEFNDVMRGGYAESMVYVSNPDTTPITVTISTTGNISQWFNFSSTTFDIDGNSFYELIVYLSPPSDVANGNYNGSIVICASPKGNVSSGMGNLISPGVAILVTVDITGEQNLSGRTILFAAGDAELGDPIPFSVSFKNDGNVIAEPIFKISIFDNQGNLVTSEEFSNATIKPTTTETMQFLFNSQNLSIGQYWAELETTFGSQVSTSNKITFDIVEKGALTTKGELIEVHSNVWAKTGEVVSIIAVFENTGETVADAQFKGEVKLNDEIVQVIESDELEVAPGSSVNLTTYFTPSEPGQYVIEGYVLYSKKITEKKSSILNVNWASTNQTASQTTSSVSGGFDITMFAAVFVMLAAILVFWFVKSRKVVEVKKKRK